jgi:hypothetical protein
MANQVAPAYVYPQELIQEEKNRRIREHQAQIAARKRMVSAMAAGVAAPLNLLAQGDSWFDYPFPVPVIGQSDIVAHLKSLPGMTPQVMSLAHHGEAAEDMMGVKKLHELQDQLEHPELNGKYDAILFSGGGNDLVGDQFRLWLNAATAVGSNPAQAFNPPRLDAILKVVKAGYEDLIGLRDDVDKTIPIFAHSYDFAQPDGSAVPCAGPWLKPGFDDRGWPDVNVNASIVRDLLGRFAAMLNNLGNSHSNFIHVQTQGTLASTDWANELHPTPDGFAAITNKIVAALRARFAGQI